MKRSMLVLCSIVLVLGLASGCGKKAVPLNTVNVKTEAEQKVVMDNFKTITNEKDVIKFIKDNIAGLSKDNATALVLGLEDVQKKKLDEDAKYFNEDKSKYKPIISEDISDKLLKELSANDQFKTFSMDTIPQLKDETVRNALNDVKERGYKIILPEGMVNEIIDYSIYKQFENFINPDIKDYIDICAAESTKVTVEDGALVISCDELFNRTIACENFITKYPTSKRIDAVKGMCSNYVSFYVYGVDNSPVFDYQTKKIAESFKDSYSKVMTNYTSSIIVKELKTYINIIIRNNYKKTAQVEQSQKDAISRIQVELKLPVQ